MTKEEKEQFDELYQYIKFKILEYNKNLRIPRYFVLRLKGLSEGKFMSNKKVKSMGEYSFKEILYTFKFCSVNIKQAISNKDKFKNEQHLFNTIMVIVEKEINNVVNRLRSLDKINDKVEYVDVEKRSDDIKYSKKEDNKSNIFQDKIKDLW